MTTLDPNRATFVRSEYRDYTTVDDTINVRFENKARTIEINTNLSATAARALADKTFAENKTSVMVFEVEFEGTMELSSIIGANPMAIVTAPKFKVTDRLMRITSVRTDYETNTTTVQVRG